MTDSQLIVAKLKTHATYKNVVPFGSGLPAVPYIVVKIESTQLGYTRARVIAHMAAGKTVNGVVEVGQVGPLETYVRKDAYGLLAYKTLTDTDGRRIRLEPIGIGQLVTTNSDGTISQEATFRFQEVPFF